MSRIFVGNDIVDLERPRTRGRSADERFVARVFDADEGAAIHAADDGDLELWARWAAKEAGFKVISKLVGTPPPFVHRAFKVEWSDDVASVDAPDDGDSGTVRRGRVRYGGHEAVVSVSRCTGGVHAVGCGTPGDLPRRVELLPRVALLDAPDSPWSGPLEQLESRLTDAELDAVHSRHSAAVRLGARAHLSRMLHMHEERIQIVCDPGPTSLRPPRVLLDDNPAAAVVSLSHDGRWIAWVLWIPNHTET